MDAVLVYNQVGKSGDAASATGTLHAKASAIANLLAILGDSADARADNTLMGWLASPIKSIQRGTITLTTTATSATATITAVTTGKTMINFLGTRGMDSDADSNGETQPAVHFCTLVLTNSTTITAARATSGDDHPTCYVSYEVIEYY